MGGDMRCSSEMGWDTRRSSKMEGGDPCVAKGRAKKGTPPLRVFLHLSLAHKINQYKVLRLLDPCTDTGADSLLFLFLFSDPPNCTAESPAHWWTVFACWCRELQFLSRELELLIGARQFSSGNPSFWRGERQNSPGHVESDTGSTRASTGRRGELQSLQQSQSVQPAVPEHPVHGQESFPGKSTTSN